MSRLSEQTKFVVAAPVQHASALVDLNVEYMAWVFAEVQKEFGVDLATTLGQSLPDYVHSALDKICGKLPPEGVFYLVEHDGKLAGMGGLRRLTDDTIEIKRIYVRPAFRGKDLGQTIFKRLLQDARQFGYRKAILDTGPFMKSAHRIYEAHGFIDRAPYANVEVPEQFHSRWRFMQAYLTAA